MNNCEILPVVLCGWSLGTDAPRCHNLSWISQTLRVWPSAKGGLWAGQLSHAPIPPPAGQPPPPSPFSTLPPPPLPQLPLTHLSLSFLSLQQDHPPPSPGHQPGRAWPIYSIIIYYYLILIE